MGQYIYVRGKSLYTEVLGDEKAPALLYIHGGPGGIGIADFIKFQGERLSKRLRVIAVEQRGVFRSEEIKENEIITFEDIIEDFEEIRKKLRIKSWSILGHSFGGYLAVIYASLYPDSIDSIIYENPSFDFSLSERLMLHDAAKELMNRKQLDLGKRYLSLLNKIKSYKEINSLLMKCLKDLNDADCNFMWFDKSKNIISKIVSNTKDGKLLWEKSCETRFKLLKDNRVYHDIFKDLSKIEKNSLLIKGKYDSITCQKQLSKFMDYNLNTSHREIIIFDFSGHYARIEEPEKYCRYVTSYVLYNNK